MRDFTQLLPTGSVVYLTNGKAPVVIIGVARFTLVDDDTRTVFFDYVGAPYPDGQRDDSGMFFNRENIVRVVFRGLDDDDFRQYLEKVEKEMKEMQIAGTVEFGDIYKNY